MVEDCNWLKQTGHTFTGAYYAAYCRLDLIHSLVDAICSRNKYELHKQMIYEDTKPPKLAWMPQGRRQGSQKEADIVQTSPCLHLPCLNRLQRRSSNSNLSPQWGGTTSRFQWIFRVGYIGSLRSLTGSSWAQTASQITSQPREFRLTYIRDECDLYKRLVNECVCSQGDVWCPC